MAGGRRGLAPCHWGWFLENSREDSTRQKIQSHLRPASECRCPSEGSGRKMVFIHFPLWSAKGTLPWTSSPCCREWPGVSVGVAIKTLQGPARLRPSRLPPPPQGCTECDGPSRAVGCERVGRVHSVCWYGLPPCLPAVLGLGWGGIRSGDSFHKQVPTRCWTNVPSHML